MALSTRRLFELERMKRELESCSDIKTLKEISHSLLTMYFKQQEAVENMVGAGWLPTNTAP